MRRRPATGMGVARVPRWCAEAKVVPIVTAPGKHTYYVCELGEYYLMNAHLPGHPRHGSGETPSPVVDKSEQALIADDHTNDRNPR